MAARRRVQDPNAGIAQITPQAAPVDLSVIPRGRAPRLDTMFIELAELSPRISDIVSTLNEEERAREKKAGVAAANDPAVQRAFQEKGFGELVRSGAIREASNPFFQIGFLESSARQVVSQYQTNVRSKLTEAARVEEADGTIRTPENLDAILQQEWALLAKQNGTTLGNFYGNQQAQILRGQVDIDSRGVYAEAVATNTELAHRRAKDRDLTNQMLGVSEAEDTDQALTNLSSFITNKIWQQFEDPVGKVADVVVATSEIIASNKGATAALAFLDDADGLMLGTTPLSKSRSEIREKLVTQRESMERQEKMEQQEEDTRRPVAQRNAVDDQRVDYVPRLFEARNQGFAALRETYNQVTTEILSERVITEEGFDVTADVLEDLTRVYSGMTSPDPIEESDAIAQVRRAMRDPAIDAKALIRTLEGSSFNSTTALELEKEVEAAENIQRFTFGNQNYTEFRSTELRKGIEVSSYSPAGRKELSEEMSRITLDFDLSFEAELTTVIDELGPGDSAAINRRMNAWVRSDEGGRSFLRERQELQRKLSEAAQQSQDKIASGIASGQDMTQTINDDFRAGKITAVQKHSMLGKQSAVLNEVGGAERFVADLSRELDQMTLALRESDPVSDRLILDPAKAQITEDAKTALREEAQAAFTELRTGKSPLEFARLWDAKKQELRTKFRGKIESEDQQLARRFSEQAGDVKPDDLEENTNRHIQLRKAADTVIAFDDWENIGPASPPILRSETVGGLDPMYNQLANHYAVAHRIDNGTSGVPDFVESYLQSAVNSATEDMKPEQRNAWISNVLANGAFTMGDITSGELKLQTFPVGSDDLEVALSDLALDPYFTPMAKDPFRLQSRLNRDYAVDVEGVGKLDKAEMESYFKAIGIPWDSSAYPVPLDDPEVEVFFNYQMSAFDRMGIKRPK